MVQCTNKYLVQLLQKQRKPVPATRRQTPTSAKVKGNTRSVFHRWDSTPAITGYPSHQPQEDWKRCVDKDPQQSQRGRANKGKSTRIDIWGHPWTAHTASGSRQQRICVQQRKKRVSHGDDTGGRPETHDSMLPSGKHIINNIIQSWIIRYILPVQAHQTVLHGVNGGGAMVSQPENGPQHKWGDLEFQRHGQAGSRHNTSHALIKERTTKREELQARLRSPRH